MYVSKSRAQPLTCSDHRHTTLSRSSTRSLNAFLRFSGKCSTNRPDVGTVVPGASDQQRGNIGAREQVPAALLECFED
jgi:hypothetical protein